MMNRFFDRVEAGRSLAAALRHYRTAEGRPPVVVVALPRGGVPVAYEVARALDAPLDVCVVRKLGVPGQEELAMGAVATGGVATLNRDVLRRLRIPPDVIDRVAAAERRELARRERLYRADRPPVDVAGQTVLLVDDGLATGATMRAAIAAVRHRGAAAVVVAVPVGAPDTCRVIADEVDDLVCLLRPEPFGAIGMWYRDFAQVPDDEVGRMLRETRRPPAPTP
jgi:predicted phosphoribosyltransferase